MMLAKLDNATIIVAGPGVVMRLVYPEVFMAVNAYSFIWECCDRFNKEPELNPGDGEPKIYVYGEMFTPLRFMEKLSNTATKIGAKVNIVSEEDN